MKTKKIVLIVLSLLIITTLYAGMEFETETGIEIEINDVTNDYQHINRALEKNYNFIEITIKNNSEETVRFISSSSKLTFLDRKERTFRHINLVSKMAFIDYCIEIDDTDLIDRFRGCRLDQQEEQTFLLAMPEEFELSRTNIVRIQLGYNLIVEYNKKSREVILKSKY